MKPTVKTKLKFLVSLALVPLALMGAEPAKITVNADQSGHPGMFEDDDGQLYMFYQANNDNGRTWFLSWVKIGWDGDKPRVIESQKVNKP